MRKPFLAGLAAQLPLSNIDGAFISEGNDTEKNILKRSIWMGGTRQIYLHLDGPRSASRVSCGKHLVHVLNLYLNYSLVYL